MTSGRRRDERGFTLVELMLSLMLFTVGILSLSATSAVVVRMMGGARQQTIAATMAHSRLERLRGLACSSPALTGGSATARGITETWTVTAPATPNTAMTLRLMTDSVTYRTPRGVRLKVYTSHRTCP